MSCGTKARARRILLKIFSQNRMKKRKKNGCAVAKTQPPPSHIAVFVLYYVFVGASTAFWAAAAREAGFSARRARVRAHKTGDDCLRMCVVCWCVSQVCVCCSSGPRACCIGNGDALLLLRASTHVAHAHGNARRRRRRHILEGAHARDVCGALGRRRRLSLRARALLFILYRPNI